METRIKLKHGRFGICWAESLDVDTYSIPMVSVSCVKLDEIIYGHSQTICYDFGYS